MDRDEQRKQLAEFIDTGEPLIDDKALDDALYSFSELGMWPDNVDSVSEEQAIMCWKIIQSIFHKDGFPSELRM